MGLSTTSERVTSAVREFSERITTPVLLIFVAALAGVAYLAFPYFSIVFFLSLALFVLILINPMAGFYLIIPFVPLRTFYINVDNPIRLTGEKYPIGAPLVFLAFIALVFHFLSSKKMERGQVKVDVFATFFLLWAAITLFWTSDKVHGYYSFFQLLTGILVMYVIRMTITRKEELLKAFNYLVLWFFIYALIMLSSHWYANEVLFKFDLINKVSVAFRIFTEGKRIGGFAPPQTASNTLGVGIFFILFVFRYASPLMKAVLSAMVLFFTVNILMAGSKGAVGALLLGLFFIITFSPGFRKNRLLMYPGVAVLFVLAYAISTFIFSESRLTASSDVSESSLSYRLQFWKEGFETLLRNNWVGEGIGGFAQYVDPWPGAHSMYFSVLFDLGIIGLSLYLIFAALKVYRQLKAILSCKDEMLVHSLFCVAGAVITVMVHGLVDIEFTFLHLWMIFGLAERVTTLSLDSGKNG